MAKNQQELNQLLKKLSGVAKFLHLDIADGKFVPSKSLWFQFRLSKKFKYGAHLMIKNPIPWIKKFGNKVDVIIFHPEPVKNIPAVIRLIKSKKKKIGLALKPETKVATIKEHFSEIDYVLILTVHPGFYGARFLKSPLKKIKQVKKLNPKIKVVVDGGMNPQTIKKAKDADLFISGSYVTKSENPKERIKVLKNLIS